VKLRFAAVGCLLVLVLSAAAGAQVPQFSADTIMKSPKTGSMQGKIYLGGTKQRMDMTVNGETHSMIADMQRKVGYSIKHSQRMYMEMNYAGFAKQMPDIRSYDPNNPCANQSDTKCKRVGTELINGRLCDKWEFTGGMGGTRTVWIDQKNHLPIKSASADGSTFEMQNIKEGAQPASLFEIPAGYRKLDMGGMMQGRRPE